MGKKLSEMTLQELWQLFPIFLTPPDKQWASYYAEMASLLTEQLAGYHVVRISHIGSTAIATIWAKPIVDILVEAATDEDMCDIARQIEEMRRRQ